MRVTELSKNFVWPYTHEMVLFMELILSELLTRDDDKRGSLPFAHLIVCVADVLTSVCYLGISNQHSACTILRVCHLHS